MIIVRIYSRFQKLGEKPDILEVAGKHENHYWYNHISAEYYQTKNTKSERLSRFSDDLFFIFAPGGFCFHHDVVEVIRCSL